MLCHCQLFAGSCKMSIKEECSDYFSWCDRKVFIWESHSSMMALFSVFLIFFHLFIGSGYVAVIVFCKKWLFSPHRKQEFLGVTFIFLASARLNFVAAEVTVSYPLINGSLIVHRQTLRTKNFGCNWEKKLAIKMLLFLLT